MTAWRFLAAQLVLVTVACGGSDGEIEESPLATWDPSTSDAFFQASSGEGSLEITEGCVLLALSNGQKILLLWPEPTSWNAANQSIEFVAPWGERAELHDGDRISAGGSTLVGDFTLFVSEPTQECETQADEKFIASAIRRVE